MNHGTDEHALRTRVMNILQPGKDSPHVAACRRYFAVEQHSDRGLSGFLFFIPSVSLSLVCFSILPVN